MQTYYNSDGRALSYAQTSPWLIGKKEDIAFFFLPVFVAIAVFFLAQNPIVTNSMFLTMVAAYGFGLGPFHQGASWFTYLDKENFAYYASNNTNRFRFFVLPPLLILTGIVATVACPQFLFGALTICHIDHLLQQSVRLSRLYRREDKYATATFSLEAASQYSVALAFSLVGFYRFDFLNFSSFPGALALTITLCVIAAVSTAAYIFGILKRHSEGLPLHVPALLFWTLSVLAWAPGAFVNNFFLAFLIPLTIHWFQFIGMNAILVERKAAAYSSSDTGSRKSVLNLSPAVTLLAVCFVYMAMFVFIDYICHAPVSIYLKGLCVGILAGLAMCHYMLDTFIWRFQDDYPKEHILPYITSEYSAH